MLCAISQLSKHDLMVCCYVFCPVKMASELATAFEPECIVRFLCKVQDLHSYLSYLKAGICGNAVGSGDAAARLAFDKIIQPAAIRFQPNIILISAGYDAHWRDPLEKLNFYSSTYHFLTCRVKQLSNKLCGELGLHAQRLSSHTPYGRIHFAQMF